MNIFKKTLVLTLFAMCGTQAMYNNTMYIKKTDCKILLQYLISKDNYQTIKQLLKNEVSLKNIIKRTYSQAQTIEGDCPVCLEKSTQVQKLRCDHVICPPCYQEMLKPRTIIHEDGVSSSPVDNKKCPICRAPF